MSKKLLVMAGGTGGHVFPGLAVAEHLRESGWQVTWLGTQDRMEARIVPEYGIDIHFIDVKGVRGNGIVRLLKAPFMVLHAVWQAMAVLRKTRPNVVLGMGGYASGPGGLAAWLMGVPLVLHEQNAAPGLTNKLLAPLARKVLTGFSVPGWKIGGWNIKDTKINQVGNPVRANFSLVSEKRQVSEQLRILVCGGSLGARVLNEKVPETIGRLTDLSFRLWHQTGRGNHQKVLAAYQEAGVQPSQVKVSEFINDMNEAYEWADILICRAGALTVSEVALAGRCAVFVPLPSAVDDHQTRNAGYLASNGAAIIMPQTELEAGALCGLLQELDANREKIIDISRNARSLGVKTATAKVANICDQEASFKL